jgi:hypothetical protein
MVSGDSRGVIVCPQVVCKLRSSGQPSGPGRVREPWVHVTTNPAAAEQRQSSLAKNVLHINPIACFVKQSSRVRRTIMSYSVAAPQLGSLCGRLPKARRLALGLALIAAPQLGLRDVSQHRHTITPPIAG